MSRRILLAAAVVAAALASPAVSAPALTGGNASGTPGSVVSVPFSLANDASVTAVQFDVLFDAAKISAIGVPAEGSALASTDHEIDSNLVASGRFRVLVLSNSLAVIPSGQLVVVPFTLSGSVATGSTVVLTISDVEMVDGNANVVGGTSAGGSISVQSSGCPVPGDIAPDGVGNGSVTLADFILARRKSGGSIAQNSRDALCGNLAPGSFTCTPPTGKRNWCATPNTSGNPIALADAIVIRRIVGGTLQLSCAACAPQASGPARVAGDLAPRGTGDGRVDIGDVVLGLRASVGLETLGADAPLADVAPARRDAAITLGDGNGVVDVADVVLMLRAAVGLETLAWPEREVDVRIGSAEPRVGFSLRVAAWPPHSEVLRVASAECGGDDSGLDTAGDRWALTCATDPAIHDEAGTVATVTYRGPRAPVPSLAVESSVIAPDLTEQSGLLSLAPR